MPATVPSTQDRVLARLAQEFDSEASAIAELLGRLDSGWTIPYVATFERGRFGNMDAARMYEIRDRVHDLNMLEEHKAVVLAAAEREGWLDETLTERILAHTDLDDLEDAWQAMRRRHHGAAQEARTRGLEGLARALRERAIPEGKDPLGAAEAYVDAEKNVPDARAALEGAKAILIEEVEAPKSLIEAIWDSPLKVLVKGTLPKGQIYTTLAKLDKSCRKFTWEEVLHLRKAVREGLVTYDFGLSEEKAHQILAAEYASDLDAAHPLRSFWDSILRTAWLDRLKVPLERQVQRDLKTRSDRAAIRAYADSYRDLLLGAPFRGKKVLGVLPAIRRPARFALIDAAGKTTDHLKLTPMHATRDEDKAKLRAFVTEKGVEVIALGAGPGCRELEQFVLESIEGVDNRPQLVTVSEESALAMQKRSKGDVGGKKAAALARRAQDPLLEWSRIEPMQVPLGPLRDEVYQSPLARRLESVRESALHEVGLDLASATTDTLMLVGRIGRETALKILLERDSEAGIPTLQTLREKSLIDEDKFEQFAPFVRLEGGEPLDRLRLPPSRYGLIDEIAASLALTKAQLLEQPAQLDRVQLAAFDREGLDADQLRSILDELRTPKKDPRPDAQRVSYAGHKSVDDLEMGTEVEGRVLRLADFGAFVDVGVAPAGLLHVSQMADRYVGDPTRIVKPGQIVRVRVLEVDKAKGRLSLTLRKGDIRKVPRTLGDAASGKKRPGAVVVKRGEAEQRAPAARFEQQRGRGGRGGGKPGGRGRPGDRDGRRDGGRGRGGDRGGFKGNFVVESAEITEAMNAERGYGGELKSFGALASLVGGGAKKQSSKDSSKNKASKDKSSKGPKDKKKHEKSDAQPATKDEKPSAPVDSATDAPSSPPSPDAGTAEKPDVPQPDPSAPDAPQSDFGQDFV